VLYFHKSPAIFKKLLPEAIFKIESSEKLVYLSFDDGPTPEVTPWVLHCLEQYNAKATFFCLGKNVQLYPDIYQSIVDKGHAVGNHTFSHLNAWKYSTQKYAEDIENCAQYVNSKLFRPPYGRIKPQQLKLLSKKYSVIMWDIQTGDFNARLNRERAISECKKGIEPGSIILMHDSVKARQNLQYILPRLLEFLKDENYSCEPIKQ